MRCQGPQLTTDYTLINQCYTARELSMLHNIIFFSTKWYHSWYNWYSFNSVFYLHPKPLTNLKRSVRNALKHPFEIDIACAVFYYFCVGSTNQHLLDAHSCSLEAVLLRSWKSHSPQNNFLLFLCTTAYCHLTANSTISGKTWLLLPLYHCTNSHLRR